jgi:hypothetical protein
MADQQYHGATEEDRKFGAEMMALTTPIVKAFMTDNGFRCASECLQVFGGHGYVREWGMEQFVRDARIAMIYEGANGIQALDLVGRKLPRDGGRAIMAYFKDTTELLAPLASDEAMKSFAMPVKAALDDLQKATMWLMQNAMTKPDNAGAASYDYMHLFGRVALGVMWVKIAQAAMAIKAQEPERAELMDAKLLTARFYMERMLPETRLRLTRISTGADTMMSLAEEMF